jgi:putative FmdB family regulatory protein
MPIYEFVCEECEENFEKLVRIAGVSQVNCPNCGSDRTRKIVSTFASRLDGGSSNYASSASDCSTGST